MLLRPRLVPPPLWSCPVVVVGVVVSAGLISVVLFEGLFGAEVLLGVRLGPQPPLSLFQVRGVASDLLVALWTVFPDLAWFFPSDSSSRLPRWGL